MKPLVTMCCLVLSLFMLAGCANKAALSAQSNADQQDNLHLHVERMIRQMFDTAGRIHPGSPLAIGTILPAQLEGGKSLPEHRALSLQIQESLVTFATQAGLSVIEFKTLPAVHIESGRDLMLSRDVEALSEQVDLQYLLTGTYSQQQHSLMVNLRLIELPAKRVVAAATDYLPNDVAWPQGKVVNRNNMIYRGQY